MKFGQILFTETFKMILRARAIQCKPSCELIFLAGIIFVLISCSKAKNDQTAIDLKGSAETVERHSYELTTSYDSISDVIDLWEFRVQSDTTISTNIYLYKDREGKDIQTLHDDSVIIFKRNVSPYQFDSNSFILIFQNYFRSDTVEVFQDNFNVFNGIVNTDSSLGDARKLVLKKNYDSIKFSVNGSKIFKAKYLKEYNVVIVMKVGSVLYVRFTFFDRSGSLD